MAGRLNVLGGCVERDQHGRVLPAVPFSCTFVARPAYLDNEEAMSEHTFSLTILNPDDVAVAEISGRLRPEHDPVLGARHPQMPVGFNIVLPVPVPMELPGVYVVAFLLDGNAPIRLPLIVETGTPTT